MFIHRFTSRFLSLNRRPFWSFSPLAAALLLAPGMQAQSILNTNLIVNGGAEAGAAAAGIGTPVATIPGWTRTGNANVLPYDLTGLIPLSGPAPLDHGFQYFVGPATKSASSTLTQNIDVSAGSSMINGGNVEYTASAYLGSAVGGTAAQVTVTFENGSGQTFSSVTLGPLDFPGNGLTLQRQIGLVPSGTVSVTVTLTLNTNCPNSASCSYGAADSLSLLFATLGITPASVMGPNLVVNGDGESGPAAPNPKFAAYIPGWSTVNGEPGASVAPYGGSKGFIAASDPGPPDRGVNVLYGGPVATTTGLYQDIDVSPAMSLIDASQVQFQLSAWLGALAQHQSPTLTCTFFDWTGGSSQPLCRWAPSGSPLPRSSTTPRREHCPRARGGCTST